MRGTSWRCWRPTCAGSPPGQAVGSRACGRCNRCNPSASSVAPSTRFTVAICAPRSSCGRSCGLPKCAFCPPAAPRIRPHCMLVPDGGLAWVGRRKMVRAAVADQPSFVVDDREVRRSGLSYSVDTLTELRREYPERSLCLLLGMDAFPGLPNWHRWRELLTLAHIVVARRPGWRAPATGPLGEVMVDHGTGTIRALHERACGCVYVHSVTQLEISSTELRSLIIAGRDPRYLVPDEVRQIILETRCYAAQQEPDGR